MQLQLCSTQTKIDWIASTSAAAEEGHFALQEVNFNAGDVLGSDGTEGEYIYLIAQGQVDVLRSTSFSSVSEQANDDEDIADEPPCKSAPTCKIHHAVKSIMLL